MRYAVSVLVISWLVGCVCGGEGVSGCTCAVSGLIHWIRLRHFVISSHSFFSAPETWLLLFEEHSQKRLIIKFRRNVLDNERIRSAGIYTRYWIRANCRIYPACRENYAAVKKRLPVSDHRAGNSRVVPQKHLSQNWMILVYMWFSCSHKGIQMAWCSFQGPKCLLGKCDKTEKHCFVDCQGNSATPHLSPNPHWPRACTFAGIFLWCCLCMLWTILFQQHAPFYLRLCLRIQCGWAQGLSSGETGGGVDSSDLNPAPAPSSSIILWVEVCFFHFGKRKRPHPCGSCSVVDV